MPIHLIIVNIRTLLLVCLHNMYFWRRKTKFWKMPNPFFKFKKFVVCHDKCAMKVGTDAVLLGAWADVSRAKNVLDIGTGTGVIALMAAQRCDAEILAVDIDRDAALQARQNADESPWGGRMTGACQDVKAMPAEYDGRFDVILSNPPYFVEKVKCPETKRNTARHTDELDFPSLLEAASRLLSDDGAFSVVLPAGAAADFISLAVRRKLWLKRQTWVSHRAGMSPKRVLMSFVKHAVPETEVGRLAIEASPKVYTPEFVELVKDYYLFVTS